jgi:hypothetical protein
MKVAGRDAESMRAEGLRGPQRISRRIGCGRGSVSHSRRGRHVGVPSMTSSGLRTPRPPARWSTSGVDHGRLHVRVAQELLDRPDVVAIFEQVRGEGMPQAVTARVLVDAHLPHRLFQCPLYGRLIEMVPSLDPAPGIDGEPRRGEENLPAELASGIRVLSLQRARAARPHPGRRRDPSGEFGAPPRSEHATPAGDCREAWCGGPSPPSLREPRGAAPRSRRP